MAANIDEEIGISQIDDDETNIINTGSRSGGCRQRLLFLGKFFLIMGCLAYNLYLIWLVAYLKDNGYYWFLSLIPLNFNVLGPLIVFLVRKMSVNVFDNKFLDGIEWMTFSFAVVLTLMSCFTILTRVAYYQRQPDQLIGPRFIIFSLQGSIILILLDFFLQREGKLKEMLDFKDALTRMLLDFIDVFNMIEILSANECVGLGSFVSEGSSTEKAIQAFCTMSFLVILCALEVEPLFDQSLRLNHEDCDNNEQKFRIPSQLFFILYASCLFQNIAFFVIRIVVWAQYNFFNLGFIVKNALVIFYFIVYNNVPVTIMFLKVNVTIGFRFLGRVLPTLESLANIETWNLNTSRGRKD